MVNQTQPTTPEERATLLLLRDLDLLETQHGEVADETHERERVDQHLVNTTSRGVAELLPQLITHTPEIVSFLKSLIELFHRKKKAQAPGTAVPPEPQPPKGPATVPPEPEPPGGTAVARLESWFEYFWHDWFRTRPENPDQGNDAAGQGSPLYNLIVDGKEAAPPAPAIRFMTGVLPQPSKLPHHPGFSAAFTAIRHVFEWGDHTYTFDSTNDGSGSHDIQGFGRVQFGPHFQESSGWDVTIRLFDHHDGGPRKLTYHAEPLGLGAQTGLASEPKTIFVSHGRN